VVHVLREHLPASQDIVTWNLNVLMARSARGAIGVHWLCSH